MKGDTADAAAAAIVHVPPWPVFDFVKNLLRDPSQLRVLGNGGQRKSYLQHSREERRFVTVRLVGGTLKLAL